MPKRIFGRCFIRGLPSNSRITSHIGLNMKIRIPGHLIKISLGLSALFVGLIIYILQRPANCSYLGMMVKEYFGILPFEIHINEIVGGSLPDFLHPFAFVLLCITIFPSESRRQRGVLCLFWLFTNLLFEMGQFYGEKLGWFISTTFNHTSFSTVLANYFIGGTYDVIDIIAIGLGILSAFLIGEITHNRGGKNHETKSFSEKEKAGSGLQYLGAVLETRS